MNLRKDHYRYPFRTPCELAFGPRPALGSASACSLPLLLGASGWGRVGMRPSVRARVVREGCRALVARFPSAPPHLRASSGRSRSGRSPGPHTLYCSAPLLYFFSFSCLPPLRARTSGWCSFSLRFSPLLLVIDLRTSQMSQAPAGSILIRPLRGQDTTRKAQPTGHWNPNCHRGNAAIRCKSTSKARTTIDLSSDEAIFNDDYP